MSSKAKTPRQPLLQTPIFRVSFPHVFEPFAFADQTPRYSLTMVFEKEKLRSNPASSALWKKILASMEDAIKSRWPNGKPANFYSPLRDGSEKEQYEGFGKNTLFITAKTKIRPQVVDTKKQPILDPEELYPGCYAKAYVQIYTYDNVTKGAAFNLSNIMKVAEGPRIDGSVSVDNQFDTSFSGELDGLEPTETLASDDDLLG